MMAAAPGVGRQGRATSSPARSGCSPARRPARASIPTNEAFAQALKTEEIACGIMWKARAVQWQNAGINVETVAPKEGVPMYVSGFVDAEERAQQGRRLRLSRRHAGSRRRRRASPSTWATTRPSPTPRCRRDLQKRIGFTDGGAEAPGRSRLRLHGQERRRVQGVVEQVVQGLMMADVALTPWPRRREAAGRRPDRGGAGRAGDDLRRDLPAGAAGHPVPLQPERVRPGQEDDGRGGDGGELRQVLHRPLLHRDPGDDGARRRDGHRRSAWCWAFRWPTCWRARRAASRTC